MEGLVGTQILIHESSIAESSQQEDQSISFSQEAAYLQVGSKTLTIKAHLWTPTNTCGKKPIPIMLKPETQELPAKQDCQTCNLKDEALSSLETKDLKPG